MNILQVSTYEKGGGAEAIAWQLFEQYRRRGHRSTLAVGQKQSEDPDVRPLIEAVKAHGKGSGLDKVGRWLAAYEGRVRGAWRLRRWIEAYISRPHNWWNVRMGRENFNFPETWNVLELAPGVPDILHCHNLHGGWLPRGGYFDLQALPWLSHRVPTVMTLHDTWMLSGHCAYTLGCDRWKIGCGQCPDLTIYPAVLRDATGFNWNRKKDIFLGSRLYVATPSRWLLRQVEQSMMAPAVVQGRVIPNGVDRAVFRPADKRGAREALGLPRQDALLLFVANAAKSNVFKDYRTVEETARRVAAGYWHSRVTLLVLGEAGDPIDYENGGIRFVPYQRDMNVTAQYYQAADLYVHAAHSDTFPNTILEALACGLPIVATAVDGIPEQVDEGRSGFLVKAKDVEAMAGRVRQLLETGDLRRRMGEQAAEIAARLFDAQGQVQAYLDWYEEIRSASVRTTEMAAHAC